MSRPDTDALCRLNESVTEPPVTLSDGTPLHLYKNTDLTNPNNDPSLGDSRTYRGHLDEKQYDPTLKGEHQLVLFHYATRSLEDYTSRKILLPGGVYAHDYTALGKRTHQNVRSEAVLAAFEHSNGFDGTSPICESAVQSGYAEHCCRARPT